MSSDHEVMAAIDDEAPERRLIIADLTADDSWLSIPAADALALVDWR